MLSRNRLEDEIVDGLDPVAPDRLEPADGIALDGVSNQRSAVDG
jgi:hypothetical protein